MYHSVCEQHRQDFYEKTGQVAICTSTAAGLNWLMRCGGAKPFAGAITAPYWELGKKHMMWSFGFDGELRKIPLDTTGRPWEEFAYQRIVQISWVVYHSDDSGPPGAPPGLLS